MMRRFPVRLFTSAFAIIAAIISMADFAGAADGATIAKDCEVELRTFCSTVTPGQDRIVACLIAFEDKATPRCLLTACLASGSLSDRMKGLQALAKTCSSDIRQYCARVGAGGGRIYDCLKANKSTLTDDCRTTMISVPKL